MVLLHYNIVYYNTKFKINCSVKIAILLHKATFYTEKELSAKKHLQLAACNILKKDFVKLFRSLYREELRKTAL